MLRSNPDVSPQNPPSASVGNEGVMILREPLIERSAPADQFFEHIVTSFQHHRQPCEEQT